jgi:uncharacterized protein YvpB
LKFVLWILMLGLAANFAALMFLSQGNPASAISLIASETSTMAAYKPDPLSTLTSTPFQPLPTDTPTPTPTATSTPTPEPTNTPQPTKTPTSVPTQRIPPTQSPSDGLPSQFRISGLIGHLQSHTLSCESRSAADWAAYYGISIGENSFQSSLPVSDNPEKGFVGSVDGAEGQIPPNSYGVHAEPVAAMLREFGASASAKKGMSQNELRQQIASGNPVIAWVIGNVWGGYPISYTDGNGNTTIVARYEHTVILTGYDEYGFTIVDGNMVYWRSNADFANSFGVLGNMAVYHP